MLFSAQVLSQSRFHDGQSIGSAQVEVGGDRVDLTYIFVHIVSGVRVKLVTERQMPGALVAKFTRIDQLKRVKQVREQ